MQKQASVVSASGEQELFQPQVDEALLSPMERRIRKAEEIR